MRFVEERRFFLLLPFAHNTEVDLPSERTKSLREVHLHDADDLSEVHLYFKNISEMGLAIIGICSSKITRTHPSFATTTQVCRSCSCLVAGTHARRRWRAR